MKHVKKLSNQFFWLGRPRSLKHTVVKLAKFCDTHFNLCARHSLFVNRFAENLTKRQFHQHFTNASYVPTRIEQLFSNNIRLWNFQRQNMALAKKSCLKCWCIWHQNGKNKSRKAFTLAHTFQKGWYLSFVTFWYFSTLSQLFNSSVLLLVNDHLQITTTCIQHTLFWCLNFSFCTIKAIFEQIPLANNITATIFGHRFNSAVFLSF